MVLKSHLYIDVSWLSPSELQDQCENWAAFLAKLISFSK